MTKADFLEQWQAHLLEGRRRSPHTVRAYIAAAARLLDRLEPGSWREVSGIDAKDLRSHLAVRRSSGLSNTSTARELSALKGFIEFAGRQCGVPGAAAPRMRGPRIKKGIPRPVTPDEAMALAQEVAEPNSWTGIRDRAVLFLLYGAGLRISEALSLKACEFPFGEVLRVTGKGAKQRVVPILPVVCDAVGAYVEACPYPLTPDGALFRGERGGPLSQGMVQKAVARARKIVGLPDTATPHALRHSFATHLLGEGADLRSLQELLGHASLSSTQIYTRVDAAKVLETFRTAHPRERES